MEKPVLSDGRMQIMQKDRSPKMLGNLAPIFKTGLL